MKVTTEELERCETLLTLEVEPAQQEKMLKKAAQRISREVKIPGFRPGKAPYNVIVRRFGMEALQSEALEQSVENLIKESIAEANLTPVAQIHLDGVEWNPALKIKIKVPTKPIVELGSYRDTRLEAKTVEVTAQDVEDALKRLQDQHATWAPVERPAEMGDLISMTVTEKDGDTVLADRQAVEYELKPVTDDEVDEAEADSSQEDVAGDDETQAEPEDEDGGEDAPEQFRPDLTTPLLGLSAGEHKSFTVAYPEDYQNEEYAGKEITFEVEVSGVKVKELDPLDDAFAQQVGDYETLEALKEKIQEDIRRTRERMNDFELGSQVLDKLVDSAEKIEWPLALEEEQVDHEIEHYEHHLKQAGLTLEAALQLQKKTKEELREELRDNVVKQLRRGLVMSRVAELEKLSVSQMEVLEQAKLMADMYGGGDRLWQSILASEARQNSISNDLLSSKVMQRLAAVAKGEAPDLNAEAAPAESDTSLEPAPASDEEEAVEESPSDSSDQEVEASDETSETVTSKV